MSEVFFLKTGVVENMRDDDWSNGEQFSSLLQDGVLQKNLDNSTYFDDNWRTGAKIFTGDNEEQYGAYPINKRTQVIAYNADYLPNGLDFSNNQEVADYLYNKDLGNLAAIKTTVSADSVTDEMKNGLLVYAGLSTGGTVWAFNYYPNLKRDQRPNEQDMAWRKRGPGSNNDPSITQYWSVFSDSRVLEDARYQKWVYHNYLSNNDRVDKLVDHDESYDKYALFNGHIGAIMIDSSWVNDQWRSGEWRTDGSSEEKATFAQTKIKFQKIPVGMVGGFYGTISNSLKNDKYKQEIAEMFLNVLTDPSKARELYQATSYFSARKDVNLSGNSYEKVSNLFSAIAQTRTVLGAKYEDWWLWDKFKYTWRRSKTYSDQPDTFFEDVLALLIDRSTREGQNRTFSAPRD